MVNETDEELLLKFIEGIYNEENVFLALLSRYEDRIKKLVKRRLYDSSWHEDVLQECRLKLYICMKHWNPAKKVKFKTYLFRSLNNLIYDWIGEQSQVNILFPIDQNDQRQKIKEVSASDPQADVLVIDSELDQIIENSIDICMKLNKKEKMIIKLLLFDGLKPQEISKELNMAINRVYIMKRSARRTLRNCLFLRYLAFENFD